ncbi:MAG: 3'(2'),5'-bisphosphate nucleotidase CysQ [Hyphomicrobiaceae bacterium]|nr:3'(2'),5'-bisphosphate nucleotidase CysQ [Hyphomicrobiaceae bacterium]
MRDFRPLVLSLMPDVMEAAKAMMRHFAKRGDFDTKSDGSPVTAADTECEAIVIAALDRVAPGVPVVAEEAVANAGATPSSAAARFFLVDPLDGTKEFISGRGDFTLNIALVEDGTPSFGLIYAPALARLYVTLSDEEAVATTLDPENGDWQAALGSATRLAARPASPGRSRVMVASRAHGAAELERWLRDCSVEVGGMTSIGSSLKFCLVADGTADLYPRLSPTMEWDTAAGHAIAVAAGAIVTDAAGAPLRYGKTERGFRNPGFIVWSSIDDPILGELKAA